MSPIRVSIFKMVCQQRSPFYTIVMPNNNNTLSLIDVGYDFYFNFKVIETHLEGDIYKRQASIKKYDCQ